MVTIPFPRILSSSLISHFSFHQIYLYHTCVTGCLKISRSPSLLERSPPTHSCTLIVTIADPIVSILKLVICVRFRTMRYMLLAPKHSA